MERLAVIAERARAAGRMAVDAEFMGEGRYRPLLCLVAVAVPTGEEPGAADTELVDPLEGEEPGPLREVLEDPAVEILFHAGRQDVAILRRTWAVEITSVLDTQIAAAFAGYGAQQGYGRLLRAVLGVDLPKTESFTRWDLRPLSERQLRYARDDVAYLPALAAAIEAKLEAQGRLEWAREECAPLAHASDERDPLDAYRRLPRSNQLKPRQLAVARELAAWRERTAAAEDRTVNAVLGDAQLVELARRQPTGRKELREIRGLFPRTVDRRGEEILAAVARGREAPPVRLDGGRAHDPDDAPLVSLCEAVARYRSREHDLAYELLTSRAELQAMVAAVRRGDPDPDVRALRGWRRELVGEDLLGLLAGRRTLTVEDGRLRIERAPD